MKKKMRKQICLLLTFIMVVTACTFNTYATEDSQSQYKESHDQINYNTLNFALLTMIYVR